MKIKHLEPQHREMLVKISEVSGAKLDDLRAVYWEVLNVGYCSADNAILLLEMEIPIIDELAEIYGISDTEVMDFAASNEIKYENFEVAFIKMTSAGGIFYNLFP